MGTLITSYFSSNENEIVSYGRYAMLGLNGVGKTTILERVSRGDIRSMNGCVETVRYDNNFDITSFSLETWKSTWFEYYPSIKGIIWVLDSSDSIAMPRIAREIDKLSHFRPFIKIPIAIFANKRDLHNASSRDRMMNIVNTLGLHPQRSMTLDQFLGLNKHIIKQTYLKSVPNELIQVIAEYLTKDDDAALPNWNIYEGSALFGDAIFRMLQWLNKEEYKPSMSRLEIIHMKRDHIPSNLDYSLPL